MNSRRRIAQPPRQRGQRTEEQFKIRPGKGNQQPFVLFRKKPGIAHVGIQAGLEIQQQETQLVNLAAKVFASQAVAKLMRRRDEKNDGPEDQNRPPTPELRQFLRELRPVENDGAESG